MKLSESYIKKTAISTSLVLLYIQFGLKLLIIQGQQRPFWICTDICVISDARRQYPLILCEVIWGKSALWSFGGPSGMWGIYQNISIKWPSSLFPFSFWSDFSRFGFQTVNLVMFLSVLETGHRSTNLVLCVFTFVSL